jgi:CRISPR-associated endonuclease Csn1
VKKDNAKSNNEIVVGLDFGTGSLGEAISIGDKIIHAASFVFDSEIGRDPGANKKRPWRTRIAHRAREFWLIKCCKDVGIEPLKEMIEVPLRQGRYRTKFIDARLLKEFPSDKEKTIFNSALLRIKLIEGNKLESWQVFKALHSAIQKRGYDPSVDWAKSDEKIDEESGTTLKRISSFHSQIEKIFHKESKRLPCYFEAYCMGLYDPKNGILTNKINNTAETTSLLFQDKNLKNAPVLKGTVYPRDLVEKELRMLLESAKKSYPKIDVEYFIYGPSKKKYNSYHNNDFGPRGSELDWQGVLGQKVPRFNNRALNKCALMPDRNTVKAENAFNLWNQVHFLLKLKNITIVSERSGEVRKLNFEEYKSIFEHFKVKFNMESRSSKNNKAIWKATAKQLQVVLKGFQLQSIDSKTEIESPRLGSRLRFCKDGLYWLREYLLSGLSPAQFLKNEKLSTILKNNEPNKGLTKRDFLWLEAHGTETKWQNFYLIDINSYKNLNLKPEDKFKQLLGEVSNPVIRHRLEFFWKRLGRLKEKLNGKKPDKVIFELVREDNGKIAKKRIEAAMKLSRERNDGVRKKLAQIKIPISDENIKKYKLWEDQESTDIYTGEKISIKNIVDCDIDHIVPQSLGGPDAYYNLALTSSDFNRRKKKNLYPHQYFTSIGNDALQGFFKRINFLSKLGDRKKKLLLSQNPVEFVERYESLASTAYLARLAVRTTEIYFNYVSPNLGSKRHVVVVNGAFTSAMRRLFDVNRLLSYGDSENKNREDKRHHALDAMVLAFSARTAFSQNKSNEVYQKSMSEIKKQIKTNLDKVIPITPFRLPPMLDENFYGLRTKDGKEVVVKHLSIDDPKIFENTENLYGLSKDVKTKISKLIKPNMKKVKNQEKLRTDFKKIFTKEKRLTYTYKELNEINMKYTSPYTRLHSRSDIHVLQSKKGNLPKLIISDPEKNSSNVINVYAHESLREKIKQLRDKNFEILFNARPLYTWDLIRITKNTVKGLTPGIYLLSGMRSDGYVELTNTNGEKIKKNFKIAKLLAAGFQPESEYEKLI